MFIINVKITKEDAKRILEILRSEEYRKIRENYERTRVRTARKRLSDPKTKEAVRKLFKN